MKVIPLIGILHFFGPLIFYKSKRAMLIFINGLIYHSLDVSDIGNQKNLPFVNFLKYYDIFTNFIITLHGLYYYPFTLKYAIIGLLIYIIEVLCVKYTNLAYYYTDIFHLIFHIIAAYSLILTL